MKNQIRVLFLALVLPMLLSTAQAQGTAFTYQGRLNNSGSAANGLYDFRFKLYFDPLGNTQAGSSYATNGIGVTNGLFLTSIDFGPDLFNGSNYWLEVDVRTNGTDTYTVLSPLQGLLPTPYAIFANSASNLTGVLPAAQLSGMVTNANLPINPTFSGTVTAGSFTGNGANVTNVNAATLNGLNAANFWRLGGNNVAPGQFLGSTNNQPLEILVNNTPALLLDTNENIVAISLYNQIFTTVSTIGGGLLNSIRTNAYASFLGGGLANSIETNAYYSFLGGGYQNSIGTNSIQSVLAGGANNSIGGEAAESFLGGGYGNFIQFSAGASFLGGGILNSIQTNAAQSFLGGGFQNSIQQNAYYSFLGGGYSNSIGNNCWQSSISGGANNNIQPGAPNSFMGGGLDNTIFGDGNSYGTKVIAGGYVNVIGTNAWNSAIVGGYGNAIGVGGTYAFIGGGLGNTNTGSSAVIPGGYLNVAAGQYSFAAGQRAQALYQGDFVWADSQNAAFASTASDQFLIRAQGGVGIGTATPGAPLDVAGPSGTAIRVTGSAGGGSTVEYDLTTYNPGTNAPTARILATDDGTYSASLDLMTKAPGAYSNPLQSRLHINSSGNVGIGTNSPVGALEVASATGWPQVQVDQLNPDYARIRLYALTNSIWDIAAQSELNFFNGSYGNVMTLEKNGRVGISSVPSTYLQVVNATCNGSSWINASDRNLKQDFAPVDAAAVLAKVVALPVQSWDYKAQPNDKHIGPVAQDFHAAFGLNGSDDKHIATVDEGGVALAAIQGLNQKLNEKDTEIAELKKRLGDLEQAIQTLASKK